MADAPAASPQTAHPLTLYRHRHRLTMARFAELAGTTAATISRIENGKKSPALAMLRQIMAATRGEVSADDIVNYYP